MLLRLEGVSDTDTHPKWIRFFMHLKGQTSISMSVRCVLDTDTMDK